MARPQSPSRATTARRPGQAKKPEPQPLLPRVGAALIGWVASPVGQQLLALTLIGVGILTIFTIAGLNSGALVNAWSRLLVYIFGWGAYPMAGLILALGFLRFRHLVHQPTHWRWRPFLGFECMLIGLLALTYSLIKQQGWQLVDSGRGGGLVGWSLHYFLYDTIGSLNAVIVMGALVIIGVALAFDVTKEDLRPIGMRFAGLWETIRSWHRQRVEGSEEGVIGTEGLRREASPRALGEGVALSPVHRQGDSAAADIPRVQPSVLPPAPVRTEAKREPAVSQAVARSRPKPAMTSLPLDLLTQSTTTGMDQAEIDQKSRIIEKTLEQFGLPATVTEVHPGPTVTQFGVTPGFINRGMVDGEEQQRKVRVSQIATLRDDLALALAARTVRIEAPVPGRAVVGIEVPNAEINLVSLRAVLGSEVFKKCGKPLCFAVGLDVTGTPKVADLSAMPHLLIAGTTGSGKSVFVKALAASLVMNNSPEVLRLVTIDPKMVELSHLNGLPHLLGRSESELERILRALRWVAHEMDRRYKLFSSTVSRNLDDFNAKVSRLRKSPATDDEFEGLEPLPRIVVFVDELADLMMSAPEETERMLTRIAQMARATGIHLVVATQRPSTDVVTGLIKANFPARVSFATASGVDSRVIIDGPGAETLLGRGDMLFLAPDAAAPARVQGCYVSESELEAIIGYWQKEAGATPAKAPWDVIAETKGPETLRIEGQGEDADLLEQAVKLARSDGNISTSGLQRRRSLARSRQSRWGCVRPWLGGWHRHP